MRHERRTCLMQNHNAPSAIADRSLDRREFYVLNVSGTQRLAIMFESVLGYQVFIIATLVCVRLFRPDFLVTACIGWTLFSLFNLFWPPLIVLQLVVVWVTGAILMPRESSETRSPTPAAAPRPPTEVTPPSAAPIARAVWPTKGASASPATIRGGKGDLPGIAVARAAWPGTGGHAENEPPSR